MVRPNAARALSALINPHGLHTGAWQPLTGCTGHYRVYVIVEVEKGLAEDIGATSSIEPVS